MSKLRRWRWPLAGVAALVVVLGLGYYFSSVGALSGFDPNLSENMSSRPQPGSAPIPTFSAGAPSSRPGEGPPPAPPEFDGAAGGDSAYPPPGGQPQTGGAAAQPARFVIKTAAVEARAKSPDLGEARRRVAQLVERLGGYIVSTEQAANDDPAAAYVVMSFRVPAERFEEALRALEEDLTVTRNQVSGADVTDEYIDNESRLRNLEATAARLRALLAEADDVAEAIEVNRTLTEYEGQIEQIKGRQSYIRDSAAMSLIQLTLRPRASEDFSAMPLPRIRFDTGWSAERIAAGALADLVELGQDLLGILIVLAVWTPVWLPVAAALWYGVRRFRRRGSPSA